MARPYIASIAGGTATVTIQIQGSQTFRNWTVSALAAAVGAYELSTSPTSQIGTTQPDPSVIARVSMPGATTGVVALTVPISLPVKAFMNVYVHCTGTGNVGTSMLN
jgi:hypothetical protein